MSRTASPRLQRLAAELAESGLVVKHRPPEFLDLLVDEVDQALRPQAHERRVASTGTILDPRADPATWSAGADLGITRGTIEQPLGDARRFADGISSWVLRRGGGPDEWLVFDRPAGSERDLTVLASVFDAVLVQRHPSGSVRVVGPFGTLRWHGYVWHHEPPVSTWLSTVAANPDHGDPGVLKALLVFAVHDLGSNRIGALLIYRPDGDPGPRVEERLPPPPPLRITKAAQLAPLRHALAQIDGAAIFDGDGVLQQLGVRLVPSKAAEHVVDAFRGTRHTSGVRYSYDDPRATVIVISDDGPVSVLRAGTILGRSENHH
jgi:hypothetical protein